MNFDTLVDDLTELFLCSNVCYFKVKLLSGIGSVNKSEVLRNRIVEDDSSDSCIDNTFELFAVYNLLNTNLGERGYRLHLHRKLS